MTQVVHPGFFLPIPDPGVKKAPDPGSATLVCIVTQALGDHVSVASERLPVEDEGLGGHQQLPQLGVQVLHLHNTLQGYPNIHYVHNIRYTSTEPIQPCL
jgi:hypothetical protein